MIDDDAVLDFLEHHGVKGMQWGVRRQQAATVGRAIGRGAAATGRATGRGAMATGRFIKAHKKETAIVIGTGALIAAAVLTHNRSVRLRDVRTRNAQGTVAVIQAHRNVSISNLNTAHREGRVSTSQGHRIARLVERQAERQIDRLADQRRTTPQDLLRREVQTMRNDMAPPDPRTRISR